MGKVKRFEPVFATCKDCGRDFIITAEEQKRFKSLGFELPKRCCECRKKRKEEKRVAEAKIKEKQEALENEKRQKKWEKDEKEIERIIKKLSIPQILIKDMVLENPSESLVIIGNGFDLMHGVKSSYWDFQKTIGKNSSLRFYMETYLDTSNLWSNLEESLGKLNYGIFLNPDIIDMWLDNFGAYDPDAQADDFFAAVETAIAPTFEIPRELKQRFKKWIKTLVVESNDRPFSMLHGDYKVLSFNYTEFIETLYGAKSNNVCYIHGCRKNRNNGKLSELILGHRPGMEEKQWDKVRLKPFKFKDPYKRYIMESALETAAREAAWYEEETTKKCSDIIKKHLLFFDGLTDIKDIFVIGHSLSEVDYPYFEEICKKTNAKWYIGYHSLDDLKRLRSFSDKMNLREITVFRS